MKTKIKFFLLGLLTSGALASPIIMNYYEQRQLVLHQQQVIEVQLKHLEDSILNTDEYMMNELDYIYTQLEDIKSID